MKNFFYNKSLSFIIITSILFFLTTITFCYFYLHLNQLVNISDSDYAFKELFINYQAGLVRRGFLGEIFWQLNTFFSINPVIFFSFLFFTMYLIQIYLFYKLFEAFRKNYLISILIFFSPALILFTVYNPNLFYLKDIFIKVSILFHAVLVMRYLNNNNIDNYIIKLKYLIIPLLSVIIFIHEYQVLFLSIHFLLSLSFIKNKKSFSRVLKIYSILIIPIFFTLFYIGDQSQYEQLNLILKKFDISVHPQLGGGFYKAIGGFYKWHFFYFSYQDFVNLFFSIFLSILIFYLIFHYLIKNKILKIHTVFQNKYYYFFLPTLACFILATDHGRNISLISTHLIAFYSILFFSREKLEAIEKRIKKNFLITFFSILFLIFYIFMWKLDQMAGFGLRGIPNDIFQSSLFAEIVKLIKFTYSFIDLNIVDLPEIRL
jgi:hypothetical protein